MVRFPVLSPIVRLLPMIDAPDVTLMFVFPDTVPVAALAIVLPLETYATFPAVQVVVVPSPSHVSVGFENENGYAATSPESGDELVTVRPEPMIDCPAVTLIPVPADTVPVATLETPAPPFDISIWPPVRFVVVASPVQLIVEFDPPISAPRTEKPVNGPLNVRDDEAIEPRVAGNPLVEVQNGICPFVSAEDVDTVPTPEPPDAEPVMVIGADPMTVNAVQEFVPAHDAVVVETLETVFPLTTIAMFPAVHVVVVASPR
jgi:hypothetical protein